MSNSKDGRFIFVHKDFAESFGEEYQNAKKEMERNGKKLSQLEFSKIFEQARKKKETTLFVQPVKTGRRAKKISFDFLSGDL